MPATLAVDRLRCLVEPGARIGLTELSRSKGWRDEVRERGILEVVDHNETAAYLVSPQSMQELLGELDELREEVERAQIDRLFEARAGRGGAVYAGEELAEKALGDLAARREAVRRFLDGD